MQFRAMWVEEDGENGFSRRVIERSVDDLPPGDVLVKVQYSSLNYKDALSATGNRGVTKTYPHTPGIDAAGVVINSSVAAFSPGSEVLVISPELGVSWPGGYGQYVRVPAGWLFSAPKGLSLREAIIYGTAGFTAAISVDALQAGGVMPDMGEVLVTGATGGVGIMAVGILAKEGYRVVAATGKTDQSDWLEKAGASRVIHRDRVNDNSRRPLLSGQWSGVVDTVGGNFLATALRSTQPGGVVTACGNAAGADLTLTVYPFILRAVHLVGIDATRIEKSERVHIWEKLGREWKLSHLDDLAREVTLDQLSDEIDRTMQGGQAGRVIVRLF